MSPNLILSSICHRLELKFALGRHLTPDIKRQDDLSCCKRASTLIGLVRRMSKAFRHIEMRLYIWHVITEIGGICRIESWPTRYSSGSDISSLTCEVSQPCIKNRLQIIRTLSAYIQQFMHIKSFLISVLVGWKFTSLLVRTCNPLDEKTKFQSF